MMMLILCLMMSMIGRAQSIDQQITTSVAEKPFELGTYMGVNRSINLMLMVNQVPGVTLTIKDADDTTLHELYMKKSPRVYHYKLNFDGSQSGIYTVAISDGRKTIIRRIEVVDIPATEAQRYITFTSPFTL